MGGESSIFKLAKYDETNDYYVIVLKRPLPFNIMCRVQIVNGTAGAINGAVTCEILRRGGMP
jgi:hypothetical protein